MAALEYNIKSFY